MRYTLLYIAGVIDEIELKFEIVPTPSDVVKRQLKKFLALNTLELADPTNLYKWFRLLRKSLVVIIRILASKLRANKTVISKD